MLPSNHHPRIARLTDELTALNKVARTLTTALELPDLLNAAIHTLAEVLGPLDLGLIMLWDAAAGVFRPAAVWGCDPQDLHGVGLQAGESITGKVFDEGVARLLNTPEQIEQAMADLRPANRAALARALGVELLPRNALAVPLQVGQRKFGVLLIETLHRDIEYAEEDMPFIQMLADLVALAIDRARLEAEAKESRDAQRTDRLRSEVMATLSHELRTPLAAIKGYSTALLIDDIAWPEHKQREFLRMIDEECDNMQVMISNVLDSALIDIGQLAIDPEPVRLVRLAQEVVDEIQHRTDIHRFVVDFPPDFPIVQADPYRLKQVFRNICDNAVKYSPNGGLVVVRGEVRPNDVVVSIADQGVGISPEDLIPLFEKYFRAKSPGGYFVPGTGLGLPVARAIIEAHKGRIWAESTVGQGTTLYFSLPRSDDSDEADAES